MKTGYRNPPKLRDLILWDAALLEDLPLRGTSALLCNRLALLATELRGVRFGL
jgi:hypothetical protein